MTLTFSYAGGEGHEVAIQWYHDGVALVDGVQGDGSIVSGSTTTTLTITDPTADEDGNYYVVVTDSTADCTLQSDSVFITIPGLCRLTITVQPIGVDTSAGNTVVLTTDYSGEQGSVTVRWYRDGVALVDGASGGSTISGATTATLTITNAEAPLAGNYYAIITDNGIVDCSLQTNTVVVGITASCSLLITSQPADASVVDGDTLDLTFTYTGTVGPFTVQWYFNGNPLTNGMVSGATISGATTTHLTITDWNSDFAGSFYAIVVDTGVVDCQAQTITAVVTELTAPANMFIWYKADGETRFADGAEVNPPIQDFSGNNLDLVTDEHPVATIPVWVANFRNGLPVFNFPATGPVHIGGFESGNFSLGDIGFPIATTGFTIAIVCRRTAVDATFNSVVHTTLDGTPSNSSYIASSISGTDVTWTGRGGTTDANVVTALDTWQVVTLTYDYTERIARLRTNDTQGVAAISPVNGTINEAQMQFPSTSACAEILAYNTKLSDAQLDQLRLYLSTKWGIAISI